MLNPTKEETQKRYNLLPSKLKEALFDKTISVKIFQICADLKIPQEEIKKLLKFSGFVFLGFLKTNEIGKEISENLNISSENKDILTKKLISEIFSEYKEELDKKHRISENIQPSSPMIGEIIPDRNKDIRPRPAGTGKNINTKEIEIRRELLGEKGPDKYRELVDEEEENPKFLKVEKRPKL